MASCSNKIRDPRIAKRVRESMRAYGDSFALLCRAYKTRYEVAIAYDDVVRRVAASRALLGRFKD